MLTQRGFDLGMFDRGPERLHAARIATRAPAPHAKQLSVQVAYDLGDRWRPPRIHSDALKLSIPLVMGFTIAPQQVLLAIVVALATSIVRGNFEISEDAFVLNDQKIRLISCECAPQPARLDKVRQHWREHLWGWAVT